MQRSGRGSSCIYSITLMMREFPGILPPKYQLLTQGSLGEGMSIYHIPSPHLQHWGRQWFILHLLWPRHSRRKFRVFRLKVRNTEVISCNGFSGLLLVAPGHLNNSRHTSSINTISIHLFTHMPGFDINNVMMQFSS